MELVVPAEKYRDSYLAALQEAMQEGEKIAEGVDSELAKRDFTKFVDQLHAHARGEQLPEGWVPGTTLWLVDGNEYIGRLSIRHTLNERLLRIGGHIGYEIRPSMRRKGYGHTILRLALSRTKELGISDALITCDSTNIGSRKIIEGAGGVLENEVPGEVEGGPTKLRYWIHIP